MDLRRYSSRLIMIVIILSSGVAIAADETVHMRNHGLETYYVQVHIPGSHNMQFMVDTGASYTLINETILAALKRAKRAHFLKYVTGAMADGSTIEVPVYEIQEVIVGERCSIPNVQVAVLPGNGRCILGLSALRKASPFIFSVDPPTLKLSNCNTPIARSVQPGDAARATAAAMR